MANRITQEERGQIIARAKQLTVDRGEAHDLIRDMLIDEFGISPARAKSAITHAIMQIRGAACRPGAPVGSRNAAKPEMLQRVVYHNARLPRWLCEWLDNQTDRGRLIETALIEKYKLTPPK